MFLTSDRSQFYRPSPKSLNALFTSSFLPILLLTIYVFSSTQHGFRVNHSTDTALLIVTDNDKVFAAMDRRDVTLLCLLDLSKCFDVVPHAGLLRKLELYNVDTHWFDSYLAGHYQQVMARSSCGACTLSEPLPNPIGTYQGTALGPLLYSVFSNDMSLYASEDACIYSPVCGWHPVAC